MDIDYTMLVMFLIALVIGYCIGYHQAVDRMATNISEDPEGFMNFLRKASKNPNKDELEFQRQGNTIYCYGKEYGFLAQATDFESLARLVREKLPDSEFIIDGNQKDFTRAELYQIAEHLSIKVVDKA